MARRALVAIIFFVSTIGALPVLDPVLLSRDTNGAAACNASCIHSIIRKTSYASAAVGMALTMMEYDSMDWCMSEQQVGWCPPTIEAVLDTIATRVSALATTNDTVSNSNCDSKCLFVKLELASRRSAIASMVWAKHKVSGGKHWAPNSTDAPDKIDRNIRLLAPSDDFKKELADAIATIQGRRSLFRRFKNAIWRPQVSGSDHYTAAAGYDILESRSDEQSKDERPKDQEPKGAADASQTFWRPRMQYLHSAPSRVHDDHWLSHPGVRQQFAEALQMFKVADLKQLESNWMKYIIEVWMHGPPTSQPKQYLDWVGVKVPDNTIPTDVLKTIRGLQVNETVWRWVKDFNPEKQLEPWEGRPDASNPDILLRGYMLQFANETSAEPCMAKDGADRAAPVIRSAWPFERTTGPAQAVLRRLHLYPTGTMKPIDWTKYNLPGNSMATPQGMRAWT
ncbi:hypothetical protein LTR53_017791, partial [Teratosphaeriaceae sp. CCFEE 6253]